MVQNFEPKFMKVGVLTAALQELTPRKVRDPDPDKAIEEWLDFAKDLGVNYIQLSAALHPSESDIPQVITENGMAVADSLAANGTVSDQPRIDYLRDHLVQAHRAIQEGIKRIRACGKAAGILATDEASTRRYMEWGTTFTAVGLDVMTLARELEKLCQRFRA